MAGSSMSSTTELVRRGRRGVTSIIRRCLWSQSLLALQQASAPEAASSSVGIAPERLERWFERVETVAAFECAECVDWRRHRPILVARAPRVPLLQLWPELKHFE